MKPEPADDDGEDDELDLEDTTTTTTTTTSPSLELPICYLEVENFGKFRSLQHVFIKVPDTYIGIAEFFPLCTESEYEHLA